MYSTRRIRCGLCDKLHHNKGGPIFMGLPLCLSCERNKPLPPMKRVKESVGTNWDRTIGYQRVNIIFYEEEYSRPQLFYVISIDRKTGTLGVRSRERSLDWCQHIAHEE